VEQENAIDSSTERTQRRSLTSAAYYPFVVIGLAVLSHGGFALSGQGFTPFYPFIQDDFDLTRTQVGFITGTIFAAATVTSSGFGWTIDRFGVRVMAGSMMILSGMVVASLYFASSFLLLLLIAAVMGSLRPVGHPAGTKAIVDWVGPKRRGTAMSVKQAGNPILGALAAAIVPPLAVAFGWRIAAVALGGFIAAGGVLILALYRDKPGTASRKETTTSFFTGMGKVMRDRDISLAVAFGFPMVGAQVATLTYFILFLNDELGVPVIVAGGMLAVLQVANIVMRIGWGIISDTLGKGRRKPVLFFAGSMTAIVLLIVALLPDGAPTWALILIAIALGGTATSWVSVHSVMLSELSDPSEVGITIGYASTVSRTGIVIAPPIFGYIADTASYQAAWLTLVGAIIVGMLFLVPIREGGARARAKEPAS
jgi:MFS transporter, ACS family, hexuronate transporter